MIFLSLPYRSSRWLTISFPSTLHLHPVLDVLLSRIPPQGQAEIRLGLQEALVNAAKHGNHLDPAKKIYIRFRSTGDGYCWVIADQGAGFRPEACTVPPSLEATSDDRVEDPNGSGCLGREWDCGRGLFILQCIFDQVQWSDSGTELTLYKKRTRPNFFHHLPSLRLTRWLHRPTSPA